jgi:hypothetical protein
MTTNLFYKYVDFTLSNIPNDVTLTLSSYLVDSDNFPFIDSNTEGLDTFSVETLRSSLPTTAYDQFLTKIAANAIRSKYNKSLAGNIILGSNIVSGISDTSDIIPGQLIKADGIPVGTTVQSIKDGTSLRMSVNATATSSISFAVSVNGWNISYAEITALTSLVDFSAI